MSLSFQSVTVCSGFYRYSLEESVRIVSSYYGPSITNILALDEFSFKGFVDHVNSSDSALAEALVFVYNSIASATSKFDLTVFMRGPNEDSIILRTDSYKVGHGHMLPHKGKTLAYFEARKGCQYSKTGFFGLQYFLILLKRLRITRDDIEKADKIYSKHLGPTAFNREGWEYILRVQPYRLMDRRQDWLRTKPRRATA